MGGVFRKHEKIRNVDKIFVRKCAIKKQLARCRDSSKQNVKINLNEKNHNSVNLHIQRSVIFLP
jgi:hypothetical protein